jgi:hypothetical protein
MMQESQRLKELIRTRTFASEHLAVVRVSHDDGAYCGAAFMPDACYFVLLYMRPRLPAISFHGL